MSDALQVHIAHGISEQECDDWQNGCAAALGFRVKETLSLNGIIRRSDADLACVGGDLRCGCYGELTR